MKAEIFIFDHDPRSWECFGNIEVLRLWVQAWRQKVLSKLRLLAVLGERNTVHRADIDAGIAFDAFRRVEYGLYVAVKTALCLKKGQAPIEPELYFDIDVFECDFGRRVRNFVTHVIRNIVGIAPLVNAHLLARNFHIRWRAYMEVLATTHKLD